MSDAAKNPPGRLAAADRTLLRQIGAAFLQILQGQLVPIPDSERRDELGLLAGIANRVATEILHTRDRDARARAELEQKIAELKDAYRVQEQLLATVRLLSSPVLQIHPGVLLMPLIGDFDQARGQQLVTTLLEAVSAQRARVVILDLTSAVAGDPMVSELIARASSAARLLGARTVFSGLSPEFARVATTRGLDLHSATARPDLHSALTAALALLPARSARA
jgi:rsbT co-antagonist protein RsbR